MRSSQVHKSSSGALCDWNPALQDSTLEPTAVEGKPKLTDPLQRRDPLPILDKRGL